MNKDQTLYGLSSLIYRDSGMDFLTRLVKFLVEEIDVCVCSLFSAILHLVFHKS
jgi:hypothetical protein